eukprot:6285571-Amphidinium_carterae.2
MDMRCRIGRQSLAGIAGILSPDCARKKLQGTLPIGVSKPHKLHLLKIDFARLGFEPRAPDLCELCQQPADRNHNR